MSIKTILSNIFKSQVQIYEFTKGTEKFYFSSGDREFLFQNRIYQPATIKASNVKASQDKTKASITVSTDKDNPLNSWFKTSTPGNVKLKIYRTSKEDPENYVIIFNGIVLSAEFKGAEIEYNCEPLAALTSKPICRMTYQTPCNHHVYNKRCGANIDEHSYFTTVDVAADGITLTLNSSNDWEEEFFLNGVIQTTNGLAGQIMSVVDIDANIIRILAPIEGFKSGDTIRVIKGCDRTSETCINRFNNFDNFFGFEAVPTRNIFQDGIK